MKLTNAKAAEITRRVKSGERTRHECAEEYGVAYSTVCRAVQLYGGSVPKSKTLTTSPKQTQLESLESKLSSLAAIAFDLAVELERLRCR